MTSLISTAAAMPLEQFHANLQSVCGQFDLRAGSSTTREVWGAVALDTLLDIEVALVATDLEQIRRTRRHTQDGTGNHFLIIQQEGRALMSQNGRHTVLSPGDMVFISSTEPSSFTFTGGRNRQASLHLPRTVLEARHGEQLPGGVALSGSDPVARAIHAVIERAVVGNDASAHLQDALLSLVAVLLLGQGHSAPRGSGNGPGPDSTVLGRAIACIDANHTDPDFSARAVTYGLDIAPHRLQRAFKQIGVTPTRYLLSRRLESAEANLRARAVARRELPIARIALDAGFSDISWFNRCFREKFGCTPGDYAAFHATDVRADPLDSDIEPGSRPGRMDGPR